MSGPLRRFGRPGNQAFYSAILGQIFLQWLPVVRIPPRVKVAEILFRKAGVVEDNSRLRAQLFQLKFNQRKNARIPIGGTPRLFDSLLGPQLYVSSNN